MGFPWGTGEGGLVWVWSVDRFVQVRLGAAVPREDELGLKELTLAGRGVPSHALLP